MRILFFITLMLITAPSLNATKKIKRGDNALPQQGITLEDSNPRVKRSRHADTEDLISSPEFLKNPQQFFQNLMSELATSDEVSSDVSSEDDVPLSTLTLLSSRKSVTYADATHSAKSKIQKTSRKKKPQAKPDEDTIHIRGHTQYIVNKFGLITAKITRDGEVLEIANEGRYWDEDHEETDGEASDDETEEYDAD